MKESAAKVTYKIYSAFEFIRKEELRKTTRLVDGGWTLLGVNYQLRSYAVNTVLPSPCSIKLLLKTHSSEWVKVEIEDFHQNTERLRIEGTFEGLTPEEAANFVEWLGWDDARQTPHLKVILDANISQNKVQPFDIKAGSDNEGHILTSDAKEKLKTTYLRPLRDAVNELSPRRNSRLSQILFSHEAFRDKENHRLLNLSRTFNNQIAAYFKGEDGEGIQLQGADQLGKAIKDCIDEYLGQFSGKKSSFNINELNLKNILETLRLLFEDGYNLGLGSHNLLCIQEDYSGIDDEEAGVFVQGIEVRQNSNT
jgi:putative ATP-dependent endonuclease of OLD family